MKLLPKRKARTPDVDGAVAYQDPHRKRRAAMVVLGFGMAILAGATVYFTGSGTAQAAPVPTRMVIVAAVQIPARTVIKTSDLAQRSMQDDPYLKTAIVDPASIVGKVSGVIIFKDQPIMSNLLTAVSADAQFSILTPNETIAPDSPTWRAVSVNVPKERAVGGQVTAGQHVDLIATVQVNIVSRLPDGSVSGAPTTQGFYSDKSTKIAWENIEILSIAPEGDLYVLKVDLHQAEEIAQVQEASSDGFTIALRPDGDDRTIDRSGYGETINRMIEQYLLPLPQIIPVDGYPQPSPGQAP